MVLGNLEQLQVKNEIRTYSHTIYKSKKWTKNLNIRPETIKSVVEVIRKNLLHIGFGDDFLDKISKARKQKQKLASGIASNEKASAQQRKQ